jgi:hypothetical protein
MNAIDFLTTYGTFGLVGLGLTIACIPVVYAVYLVARLFGYRDLFPKKEITAEQKLLGEIAWAERMADPTIRGSRAWNGNINRHIEGEHGFVPGMFPEPQSRASADRVNEKALGLTPGSLGPL